MAVDANVLIFERIREELKKRNQQFTLLTQVIQGQNYSFRCEYNNVNCCCYFICFWFRSGQRFCYHFGIGIITTLFTAYFLARHLTSLVVLNKKDKEIKI